MARTKTNKLLPIVFQTETNEKFLSATLDNLVTEPNLRVINGFIGRKFAPEFKNIQSYLREPTATRADYQLEPAVVVKNNSGEVELHRSYTEILQDIQTSGGIVSNPNRLFSTEYTSYYPQINLDLFSNYTEYYWIPNGPPVIEITNDVNISLIDGNSVFTSSNINLTDGLKIKFVGNVTPSSYKNKEYYVDRDNNNITLVPVNELNINRSQPKSTFNPETSFTYDTVVELGDSEDKIVIRSNGTPDNTTLFTSFTGLQNQNYEFVYPYRGGLNLSGESDSIAYSTQSIAISSVGIPFYGVSGGRSIKFSGGETLTFNSVYAGLNTRDEYGGELVGNVYVYRDATFLTTNSWSNISGFTNGFTNEDGHSKIIGFSADGYPIYGPYGYSNPLDSSSSITRMTSGYDVDTDTRNEIKVTLRLTGFDIENEYRISANSTVGLNPGMRLTQINGVNVTQSEIYVINNSQHKVDGHSSWDGFFNQLELNTPYSSILNSVTNLPISENDKLTFEFLYGLFIEDYTFNQDIGTLDEHNGRFCVTPEFPLGTYAYFLTIDSENRPVYPYIIGKNYFSSISIDTNQTLSFPNYIVINRASGDRNPWSRRNRWFHREVLQLSNTLSKDPINLSNFEKAKRPVIEFNKNLQLYNFGKTSIGTIDLVDTTSKNILENIQGKSSYVIDGITLIDKMKIIFSNEDDFNLANGVWQVNFTTQNENTFIVLDKIQTAQTNDTVVIKNGDVNVNKNFWFDGSSWIEGQSYQNKTSFPFFDVVDENNISFSNEEFYPSVNPSTKFVGTNLFSYKISSFALNDPFLEFPISYRSLNNLGDIEFNNNFDNDTFQHRDGINLLTKKVSSGFLIKNEGNVQQKLTPWKSISVPKIQPQIISYVYDGKDSNFIIDCPIENQDTRRRNLKIYVNYDIINESSYRIDNIGSVKHQLFIKSTYVVGDITRNLKKDDKIDIVVYSPLNSSLGYYQIPENLELNAENQDFDTITLGEIRDHIIDSIEDNLDFQGTFPGNNNMRDIDANKIGGRIVRQTAPLSYAALFLSQNKFNFINSVYNAQDSYAKFKNKFMTLLQTAQSIDSFTARSVVDRVLSEMNSYKNSYSPWYSSEMIPTRNNFNKIDYRVIDRNQKSYPITSIFNDAILSNKSVLVYLNSIQLVKGKDFSFSQEYPLVIFSDSLQLEFNDEITIYEYSDTLGGFCPETPTKLGLFPKFEPEIFVDTKTNTRMIRGHDGSLTRAFNDFKDEIILELETRIYNNIKIQQKDHLLDFYYSKPGKFRDTEYSLSEFNSILSQGFYHWLTVNKIKDFTTNNIYKEYVTDVTGNIPLDPQGLPIYTEDPNRFFSYNYKNTKDLDGELLPGSWRACYEYYYDTQRPNTHPWEMLGFQTKPSWWESEYGPSPYTSGNTRLWEDLQEGRIRSGERAGIDLRFARPELLSLIPVDSQGNLLAPADILNVERIKVDDNWSFGNYGPIETAWRNSSEYRFSLQIAFALMQPAKYFSYGIDTNKYKFDAELGTYSNSETNKQLSKSDIKINGLNGVFSSGYLNWIDGYLNHIGIIDKNVLNDYVQNHSIRMSYRIAGFTSKDRIKAIAEQYSPQSTTSGVLIQDNDYDLVLSESSPVATPTYSAIIVERVSGGYKVSGYDTQKPYFLIISPNYNGESFPITVNKSRVNFYSEYLRQTRAVPYNTVFKTAQQVTNFISGYEKYLTLIGFEFGEFDSILQTTRDWKLSAKEFLFWTQQGWPIGSLISLSPVGSQLTFNSPISSVSEIQNIPTGTRIQNQNLDIIDNKGYSVNRQENTIKISLNDPVGNNISFAKFHSTQKEHVIIFNNKTQFNDTIYNPILGDRQFRIKLVGKKTANWSGSITPEGFILNQDTIEEWVSNTDYSRGTLIKFKNFFYLAKENVLGNEKFDYSKWKPIDSDTFKFGLLPNFSTISGQSRFYFDVDNINLESDFDRTSLGLIGYRNRSYFDNYGLNDTTQVKLYQGFIKEKGTKNAINAVTKITNSETTVKEKWGLRVGEFGSLQNNQYIDIQLSESKSKGDPITLEIAGTNDVIYKNNIIDPNGIINFSDKIIPSNLFLTETNTTPKQKYLKTAGFVNIEDADYIVYDIRNLDSVVTTNEITSGDIIWCAIDYKNNWNVFRVYSTKNQLLSISNQFDSTLIVNTKIKHGFNESTIVAIKTDDIFSGFYKITNVIDDYNFTITYEGEEDLTRISVIEYENVTINYLSSVYLLTVDEIVNARPYGEWKNEDKIWVDNDRTGGWAVYEKSNPWKSTGSVPENPLIDGLGYGQEFALSADGNFLVTVVDGKIFHYKKDNNRFILLERVELPNINNFDYDNVKLFFSSNVFVISSPKSFNNRGAILIFKYQSDNKFKFAQILSDDERAFLGNLVKVSKNNNWLYLTTLRGNLFLYSYRYAEAESMFKVLDNIAIGDTEFEIDIDFSRDLTVVRTENRYFVPFEEYEIRVVNGIKKLIFNSPLEQTDNIILSQESGYVLSKKLNTLDVSNTLSTNMYIRNFDCSDDGRQILASFNNVNEVYVFDNSIDNFVYTGNDIVVPSIVDRINFVYLNGVFQRFGIDYFIDTSNQTYKLVFNVTPTNGSIISVETNRFKLIQSPISKYENSIDNNFGESVSICPFNCSLYVSSPDYKDGEKYNVGIVERWINEPRLTGEFLSNYILNSSNMLPLFGTGVRINGFNVFFDSGVTLDDYINKINQANIPGVTAEKFIDSIGSRLKIKNNFDVSPSSLNILPLLDNFTNLVGSFFYPFRSRSDIKNPTNNTYDRFGKNIIVSNNEILISSPTGVAIQQTTFDLLEDITYNFEDNVSETTFDGDTTTFTDKVDSGCVWTFSQLSTINNETIIEYVQQLTPENQDSAIFKEVDFGYHIEYNNNILVVGAPATTFVGVDGQNHGAIYSYEKNPLRSGWDIVRQKESKIDINSIERLFVYSKKTNNILYGLDYIDPVKGKILGIANQDIKYKTEYDPAKYNLISTSLNDYYTWGEEHIGEVWWDLSTMKYIDYEQGSTEYRTTNWGKLFPGSKIDVYEWVESDYPPNLYVLNGGNGIPRLDDATPYSQREIVDEFSGTIVIKYYFWVKDKTTIPINSKNRRIPIITIADYIENPRNSGIRFMASVSTKAVAVFNVFGDLVSDDRVLHISYKTKINDDNLYSKYVLLDESSKVDSIPSQFITKIADSLSGFDGALNAVPDSNLPIFKKLGLNFRPRQTAFVDKLSAVKVFVEFCNNVLAKYNLSSQIDFNTILYGEPLPSPNLELNNSKYYNQSVDNYVDLTFIDNNSIEVGYKILVIFDETNNGLWSIFEFSSDMSWKKVITQEYSTQEYWEYLDWYAEGYDNEIIPQFTLEDFNDFNRRAIYNIDSFTIIDGGENYSESPTITITGGGATVQALANATVINGRIINISIVSPSTGYLTQPFVTITDSSGTGASILANIKTTSNRIIKIKNNGTGNWSIIRTTDTGYETIAVQNGTIKLKDSLWDLENNNIGFDNDFFDSTRYDLNPFLEIRKLFLSFKDSIFINEFEKHFVELIFSFINYVLSEQKFVDWVFKTSLIDIEYGNGELKESKIYSPYNSDIVRDYIDEIKPYHTVVREFVDKFSKIEILNSSTTDFDISPYFDNILGLYRSPEYNSLLYPQDQSVFEDSLYQPWLENYLENNLIRRFDTTLKFDRITYGNEPRLWIASSDRNTAPEYKVGEVITYIRDQNSTEIQANYFDAEGETPFDYYSFGGEEEDNPFVSGKSYVVVKNFRSTNVFREQIFLLSDSTVETRQLLQPFQTTEYVKISLWQPNTTYYQDQIVVNNNIPYLVINEFTSNDVFSGLNLDKTLGKSTFERVNNAVNRVLIYYNPSTGRIGKDLGALMYGIDYNGIITQGLEFLEYSGGFDYYSFDTIPFDELDLDSAGRQLFRDDQLDSIVDGQNFTANIDIDTEVIVDGDGFVTKEYSHAPEELLPGRVYDTMDMKIITLATDATDTTYITWINGDAYTLTGFIGNGGSNIASANLTFVGYKVIGNIWLEPNIGTTYESNTVVINNLPIVGNSIDIGNITIDANIENGWIYTSNIIVDVTPVANTTLVAPKLWPNLTQDTFTNKFNYHIWKDMNDVNEYLATNISTTATLVSNLEANLSFTNIEVNNSSILPEPVIVISDSKSVVEALNSRLDINSVNYISNISNYTFNDIQNAVYEVYGNVIVESLSNSVIVNETIYNPKEGLYLKPGVIMINGERMEYWSKFDNENILVGVRRGTKGTGVVEHYAGEKVYDYTKNVPGVGFETWTPSEDTQIQTQKENTYLNFDDIITEDGNAIITEDELILATDGKVISGLSNYIFEDGENYIRTRIFNLPTPGPDLSTESGDLIILDGTSPDTTISIEPPTYPTDGRGLYNSGISSPNVTAATFVINSLYEE